MPLGSSEIDSVYSELQAAIRVERSSKRVRKLENDFYRKIVDIIDALNREAKSLISTDIDRYLRIKNRVSQIENDFKTFYLLRYGKILKLSLYEIQSKDLKDLLPVERNFLLDLHNIIEEHREKLLDRFREQKPQTEKEKEPLKKDQIMEEEAKQNKKTGFALVRITEDYPPIAQNDRNYYLRKNDILYLPQRIAEILRKRNAAVPINLRKG